MRVPALSQNRVAPEKAEIKGSPGSQNCIPKGQTGTEQLELTFDFPEIASDGSSVLFPGYLAKLGFHGGIA